MHRITGIALVGALFLAGCGGGGGGGDVGQPVGVVPPAPTSVSGTAAKGIIKQAKVLVCRIINGVPEPDASCLASTTANDGSFKVSFADGYTGPVMVKVMAAATSMMSDEATGTDIPYAMTMRAVAPAVSGSTTVYVTPFSEMAAAAASTATMDPTKISQAIAAVQSTMMTLGIDLSVMPMVDLKDSGGDPAVVTMQANMVKQLARLTLAARTSDQLRDGSGVACNVANTTESQQIACAVNAMAGVMMSYVSADPAKAANLLAAMNAQNVTHVSMPILKADGTIDMETVDMTSFTSMQTAMQNAGMTVANAQNMVNTMMRGMH